MGCNGNMFLFSAVKAQDSIVQSTELNNGTTLYNMIVHVLLPMGQDSGYWITSLEATKLFSQCTARSCLVIQYVLLFYYVTSCSPRFQ